MKQEIAEQLAYIANRHNEENQATVDTYSGRGMYGSETHAIFIESDDPKGALAEALAHEVRYLGTNTLIDLLEAIGKARTDNMGKGYVIY